MLDTYGISVLDLCEYVTSKCTKDLRPVSNLQLQKILYTIQKEFVKEKNAGFYKEDLVAWDFGPVVPVAYKRYSIYGAMPIIETDTKYIHDFIGKYNLEMCDLGIIDRVISDHYDKDVWSIRDESHKEGGPWYRAYYTEDDEDHIITLDSIQEYGL